MGPPLRAVRTIRAAALLAGALALGPGAAACPSCASSAAPEGRSIWPAVGAFMLVPWVLAAGAVVVVRRNSRPS